MRIAPDTNVLVRFLTRDDEDQAEAARAAMEEADTIVIPTVVLCEVAWVLKRSFRVAPSEIADRLGHLLRSRNVEVDRPAAEAALRHLARGGDFADGIIRHEAARLKCDRVITFDHHFAAISDAADVVLLDSGRHGR